MSTRDRGRQPTFSRLLSWAGVAAPPRGPSQRQPSRVTTTSAQPQSPAAQDQPPLPPQTQRQLPPSPRLAAPSRRSSQPPASSQAKPQMGAAPSRPASETRPPWTPATARAPPTSSPSDTAPPRSQPGEGTSQPTVGIPSTNALGTYTQPPPSPSRSPSRPKSKAPRGRSPSPSPPPPSASTAQPPAASPAEPMAPSKTPSPAPTPPPAASRPYSPPAKPPSPQIRPASPKVMPEIPSLSSTPTATPTSPAAKVLQLEPASTDEQKEQIKEEVTTTEPPAKLHPQETSQGEDQTPIDSASSPVEVVSQPPVPEAGDKPMPTVTPTIPYPAPETQPDKTGDQRPPKKEMDQKQAHERSEPPKPEPEPEPEEEEEQKPLVISPEADQKSEPGLLQDIGREVEGTEEEKELVNPPEPDQESTTDRSKIVGTIPEELKGEAPKMTPGPTPDENIRVKDHRETTTSTAEAKLTPDGQPQIKDSQETATSVAEKDEQTGQDRYQQPTQVHIQPIREVKVTEAQQPERQTPPPEKEPAPPSSAKGKDGKIAISTVARTSRTSGVEQSGNLHKEIKEGISRLVQNLAVQHSQQTGAGHGISIITLAGDNLGASMYVGYGTSSRDGNNSVFVHKGPLPMGGDAMATGEDGQKRTEEQQSPMGETNASVNSNVQAINNSILHDSCCSEENPGVHLILSTNPTEIAQPKETAKPAQLQRPRTRAPLLPKLTLEPTVRRRCLRGLFLEPSDDDPENPQKPRRHGCRFSCEEKKNAEGDQQDGSTKRAMP